jgi:hypothetical protein
MSGPARARARWYLRTLGKLALSSGLTSISFQYAFFLWFLMRARTGDLYFEFLELVCGWFLLVTVAMEVGVSRQLAFLSVRPLPTAPRWLLLGLLCALAVPLAIVCGAMRLLSPLAALTTLGCSLWAIAVARWAVSRFVRRARTWAAFAGNVLWGLALLPLAWLAPLASWARYHAGGWAAAAAVAMAFGIVGLALQPHAYLGWNPTPGWRARARRSGAAERPRAERSRSTSRGWLATVGRLWRLDTNPAAVVLAVGAYGATFLAPTDGLAIFALFGVTALGLGLCVASAKAKAELLASRPFSRAQLFVARALPWLLLALVMPVTALVRLVRSSGRFAPVQLLGFALCSLTYVLALGTSTSTPWQQGDSRWPNLALAAAAGMTGMAYVMSVELGSEAQVPLLVPLAVEAAVALVLWRRHVVWMRRR